jgi:hypothetical protein
MATCTSFNKMENGALIQPTNLSYVEGLLLWDGKIPSHFAHLIQ